MKIIRAEDKGFFATLVDTARQISHCINNNEEWFVVWGSESLYYDATAGSNVYEYYFTQPHVYKEPNSTIRGYTELIYVKNNKTFRDTMQYILTNFFKLNEKTQALLTPHYDLFNKNNILGIHIRRTDKFVLGYQGTTSKQAPLSLDLYIKEIDKIHHQYDYIYLATDCMSTCDYMKSKYGKKLIYNRNAHRGTDGRPVHQPMPTNPSFIKAAGYEKGLEALTDAIFLSKCKFLIRSSSNVSLTSLYYNIDLPFFCMNTKYSGEDESTVL